ncbi:hypothetical protein AVEN_207974-1 [Araneus ventricosus]|uniref:Fe2OG dioxygenase domain-containing protein n=1 Tax=Araneus ventricosus TaxID=182803 RepID=A0A4Y2NVI2_ARAVE|nr:hypothetical protein AVEN_207974-1 [Araneus ventricosus]
MSSTNITYISNFYSQEESIEMFTKLSKCPFKQPIIKVRGKPYRPLRKSCSYGDMDLDGHAKIGAHKDDEPTLDQTVDIATLSFGACRDMIFSKKGCKSVRKALEAGSILLMHDQKEWTHAIPPQPCVKEPRICLTFRRVWSSLQ